MNGPPNEAGAGAPHQDSRPTTTINTRSHETTGYRQNTAGPGETPGSALVWLPCTWTHRQDVPTQLRRRHGAKDRSVRLECGCGARDPILCRCTKPPLSDRALDGWRDTALHVLRTGHMPVLPIEVRRALWKRGGADRVLAELLHDACGGEVAQ